MFLGHFAVAFASKRVAPRASLAWFIAASELADILWPVFLLLGWEHVRIDPAATRFTPLDLYDFPWSHSLAAQVVWATLFAGAYWVLTRYRRGAVVLWLLVPSHWVLDWIAHRPDMPLYPGSPRFGLGLWNSIPATMVVELAMFAAGLWLYGRATRPKDSKGTWGFVGYVIVQLLVYIAGRFSPPPASVKALIWGAILFALLFVVWSDWFDPHRIPLSADFEQTLPVKRGANV